MWDFDDLDASEGRFRAQLEQETTDTGRAEVLTQLARVEGLRGRYEQCDALLDQAEALGGAEVRVLLERGRRERSSGRPGAGLAQFEQAFEQARESDEDVLAVDAAHMVAIVGDSETWTARAVAIAASSDDPGVRYWLGPLYNNVGWSRYESQATRRARSRRSSSHSPPVSVTTRVPMRARSLAMRSARRCARSGAQTRQRRRSRSASPGPPTAGVKDGYFHEELAEDYAALGRYADAREQARRALELTSDDDDPSRVERLRDLSGGSILADSR